MLGVGGQHVGLVVGGRVAERDADHEPVELRLRQRVGALVLDRVLGGEDHERPRQLVGVLVDRDVALLHALQQAGLRLGRCTVDLVDENHVREHGARPELEAVLPLVEDVGAHHVGREQVGRALDARVLGVDRARQGACQRRLPDPRVVLDQHVPLGEQRDQHVADRGVGRLDGPGEVGAQSSPKLLNGGGIELGKRGHGGLHGTGAEPIDRADADAAIRAAKGNGEGDPMRRT